MNKEQENKIYEMKEKDIIAKLQGTYEAPTDCIVLHRLGIPVELKGLTKAEMDRARKASIERKKVKGQTEERLNNSLYDANIIVAATTNFDWEEAKPSNYSDAAHYIVKKLLGGEIQKLATKVMELSGYGEDDAEESDEEAIKNSLEEVEEE